MAMSTDGPSFELRTGTPRAQGHALPLRTIPSEGETVRTRCGEVYRLQKRLGAGAEGAVFLTDKGLACKLFQPRRLTSAQRDKVSLMVSRPISHPGVCWPRAEVLDESGAFLGYLMPRADGIELQRSVFIKPLLLQHFPAWTRLELVTLARTIVAAIEVLHRHNVLLGDINPRNILVRDHEQISLVDADSFQVEDHACPVGTPTFLAPEMAGVALSTRLRTPREEAFAVATLVFMILMPGKPPYSHCGGQDPGHNVLERHFPYCLGEHRSQGAPQGPWRFIWSHLPHRLKKAFYAVFAEGKRLRTDEWLVELDAYARMLRAGHVSSDLFPAGLKRLSPDQLARYGVGTVSCYRCGAPCPSVPQGRQPTCPSCRQALEATVSEHPCADCGSRFTVTLGEQEYLAERGLSLPRRCKACRQRRRALKAGALP